MRRDLVFVVLFIAIVSFFLFFFLQAGPSSESEDEATPGPTPSATTGTATASGEAPLRVTRSDGSTLDPDAPGSEEARKRTPAEKAKPVERSGSSSEAGLDHVVETIDFEDSDMADVFAALEAESGLKFYAPEHLLRGGDEMKVSLRASKITVRSVLELVTLTKRLTWEARPDGTIHIAEGD